MRVGIVFVLVMLGCGSSKPAATAPKAEEEGGSECWPTQYRMLPRGVSQSSGESNAPAYDKAIDAAEKDVAQANEAASRNDFTAAANHFVACAKRFDAVPKTDPLYDSGQAGLLTCYENASLAYANAGLYAKKGKPLLEAARKEHPECDAQLKALLADPPTDCEHPPKVVAPSK